MNNIPPIPPTKVPRVCMACKTHFLHEDFTMWVPICQNCSKDDLYTKYLNSKREPRNSEPKAGRESERKDDKAVYFVTFTSQDYLDPQVFLARLERILKSNAYPVIHYYGCFEFTANGRLHMHMVFQHKLLRDKRGEFKYPCAQYYRTCNGGELIKKQKVKDQSNLDNVYNYIDKDEKTPDELIGEKFAF